MSRVLVVHSDRIVVEEFDAALTAADFRVQTTTDPVRALDFLDLGRPDVLVTRIYFGDGKLNGLALGRMARMRHPGMPVLFVCYRKWDQLPDGLGQVLQMPMAASALVTAVGQMIPFPA